jgi:hypothetical protein
MLKEKFQLPAVCAVKASVCIFKSVKSSVKDHGPTQWAIVVIRKPLYRAFFMKYMIAFIRFGPRNGFPRLVHIQTNAALSFSNCSNARSCRLIRTCDAISLRIRLVTILRCLENIFHGPDTFGAIDTAVE